MNSLANMLWPSLIATSEGSNPLWLGTSRESAPPGKVSKSLLNLANPNRAPK